MGVVFFLVFALICIAIGIIPLIAGIVMLVRRARLKKKTGKKYRKRLVGGIALTGFGFLFAGVPIIYIVGVMLIGVVMKPLDMIDDVLMAREAAWFQKNVKTEKMADDPADDGASYFGFTLDGEHYVHIQGMELKYKDKHRGDAVANIDVDPDSNLDALMTIFEYKADFCDRLLCLDYYIYCPEKELDKVEKYYQSQKFKYTFDDEDVEFSDDMFFSILDIDEEKLEKCSRKKALENVEDDGYTLEQHSEDGLFEYYFAVFLSEKDELFLSGIDPMHSEDEDISNKFFRVTDDQMAETFLSMIKDAEGD